MATDQRGSAFLHGTLQLLILRSLVWGPRHGFSILGWIRFASEDALEIEEGALYPALHRMQARGWLEGEWGLSENNRRARFYRLTGRGRQELAAQTETWQRHVARVARLLAAGRESA